MTSRAAFLVIATSLAASMASSGAHMGTVAAHYGRTHSSAPRAAGAAPVRVLPNEGWLAYESTSFRIRLVRPDGSQDHALDSVTVGPEDNPDWSPDGRRLTFVGQGTDPSEPPGLWVVDANGRGLDRVVRCTDPCQYLDDPAWSPDGRMIAYSRQAPEATRGGTLETVDLRTGKSRTVLAAAPGEFYAGVRYSPDGRSVVLEWVHASPADYENVTAVTLARVDLWAIQPRPVPLTDPLLFAETADWSPSGEYISYAALPTRDASEKDVYLIRPDGTGLIRVTSGANGMHTDFTNNSGGIYFSSWNDDGPVLHLVDLATRTVRVVGSPPVHGFHPRTRPER